MFQYTVNKDIKLSEEEPKELYNRNQYDSSESNNERNPPFNPNSGIPMPLSSGYSFPSYNSPYTMLRQNHNAAEGE